MNQYILLNKHKGRKEGMVRKNRKLKKIKGKEKGGMTKGR